MEKKVKIVRLMILIYCRGHKHKGYPCPSCRNLINYSKSKAMRCESGELYCSNCPTSCYSKIMKEKMRNVMRYSGPRMIIYHPILALEYLLSRVRRGKDEANM